METRRHRNFQYGYVYHPSQHNHTTNEPRKPPTRRYSSNFPLTKFSGILPRNSFFTPTPSSAATILCFSLSTALASSLGLASSLSLLSPRNHMSSNTRTTKRPKSKSLLSYDPCTALLTSPNLSPSYTRAGLKLHGPSAAIAIGRPVRV